MASPSEVGAEVAAAMTAAAAAVASGTKRALREIGDRSVTEFESAASRAVRGGRLRNHGGIRLSADARGSGDSVDVTPRGPWGILEPGARPHPIASGRPMRIGPRQFRRGPFRHPGTPDTGAWTAGYDATAQVAAEVFDRTVGGEVESAFGG